MVLECDYRWDVDWILDLLTTYIHHSELLVYSATARIHRSPQHPLCLFPACCVFSSPFYQRLLTVEILELPAVMLLLCSKYPTTELLSTVNSTIAPSLLSLPCRVQHNCQPSTKLSLTNHFTQLNWIAQIVFLFNSSVWTTSRTLFMFCWMHVCFRRNMFTEPLLRSRLHNSTVPLLQAIPSNDHCLP
jgi:hypothetical protein